MTGPSPRASTSVRRCSACIVFQDPRRYTETETSLQHFTADCVSSSGSPPSHSAGRDREQTSSHDHSTIKEILHAHSPFQRVRTALGGCRADRTAHVYACVYTAYKTVSLVCFLHPACVGSYRSAGAQAYAIRKHVQVHFTLTRWKTPPPFPSLTLSQVHMCPAAAGP